MQMAARMESKEQEKKAKNCVLSRRS